MSKYLRLLALNQHDASVSTGQLVALCL